MNAPSSAGGAVSNIQAEPSSATQLPQPDAAMAPGEIGAGRRCFLARGSIAIVMGLFELLIYE